MGENYYSGMNRRELAGRDIVEGKTLETESKASGKSHGEHSQEKEEESGEEGECKLCLFIKAGECKESFLPWDKCTQDAKNKEEEEEEEEKCFKEQSTLIECMQEHSDYYQSLLGAAKHDQEDGAGLVDALSRFAFNYLLQFDVAFG